MHFQRPCHFARGFLVTTAKMNILLVSLLSTQIVIGGAAEEESSASVSNVGLGMDTEIKPVTNEPLNETAHLYPDELLRVIKIPVDYDRDPDGSTLKEYRKQINYIHSVTIEDIVPLEASQSCNVTLKLTISWTDWRLHFRDTTFRRTTINSTVAVLRVLWFPLLHLKNEEYYEDPYKKWKLNMFPMPVLFKICIGCARFEAVSRHTYVLPIKYGYRFYPNDRHELLLEFSSKGPTPVSDLPIFFEHLENPTYYIRASSRVHQEDTISPVWLGTEVGSTGTTPFDLIIVLSRKMNAHLIRTYIPSGFFVALGWLSMLLPTGLAEARVTLCTGLLLTVTTFFNTASLLGPTVTYLRAIDVWLLGTITCVFVILIENVIVLRFAEKSRRKVKNEAKIASAMFGIIKLQLSQLKIEIPEGQAQQPKPEDAAAGDSESRENGPESGRNNIARAVDKLSIAILTVGILSCNVIYWCWILTNPQTPCEKDDDCAKAFS